MNCSTCGTLIESNANFCKNCGQQILSTNSPVDAPEKPTAADASLAPRVSGWLLLLCVGLTVIGPAVSLYVISNNYAEFSVGFKQFPDLRLATAIDSILYLAISIVGIYVGYLLWRVRPKALLFTYVYLVTYAIFSFASPILFLELANLPREIEQEIEDALVDGAVRGVVFSVFWLVLLFMSDDVQNTYR